MRDTGQLPLDLPTQARFGAEDFLVSESNAAAHGRIAAWPDWPSGMLALAGPPGSGKSHLTAIWAARARAQVVSGSALGASDIQGLAASGAVAVEDADGEMLSEAALFHLLNLAQESGVFVLVTGKSPPASWPIRTADLASRLRKMPVAHISAPDDALIRALLVKLFADRQLAVDAQLVAFLAVRIERSFDSVRATVAQLDRESLALGRRLTRASAAQILGFAEGAA